MRYKNILFVLLVTSIALISCDNKKTAEEEDIVIPEGYVAERENDMCFDEDEFSQLYNYSPCVMVDGNEAHIYFCTSMISGKAQADDRIGYRHGIKKDGVWYWGPKTIALDKGEEGEWDSMDVCDPDVIKGEFSYNGEQFNYLMTYLGCITPGNYENAYGFCVSKEPSGPWIRVDGLCPLYDFYEANPDYVYPGHDDPKYSLWGWGQSSMISFDKKGKVLVFDTGRSITGQTCELWDFSNLNAPTMIWSSPISNRGMNDLNGHPDTICNAQLVYDPKLECFYMLSDAHPFDETIVPENLPTETNISMINDFNSENIGDCFLNPKAVWAHLGSINPDNTGFPKNSNACFERDPYGWMIQKGNSIDILYSAVPSGVSSQWIFSFRIYRLTYKFE